MKHMWQLATPRGQQSGWRTQASEQVPNPSVWLVLHGGPGSGASGVLLEPFVDARHPSRTLTAAQSGEGAPAVGDVAGAASAASAGTAPGVVYGNGPALQAWAPHQRGSAPVAGRRAQRVNLGELVDDLEALRQTLGVQRWSVLGGSWGATLALAYASRYPQAVRQLVLRGAFMAGSDDVWALVRRLQALPSPATNRLRRARLTAPRSRLGLAAWLRRLRSTLTRHRCAALLQQTTQAWAWAEAQCLQRGAARALLHAAHAGAQAGAVETTNTAHAAQERAQRLPASAFEALQVSSFTPATVPPMTKLRATKRAMAREGRRVQAQLTRAAPQGLNRRAHARKRVQAQVHMLASPVGRQLRASLRHLNKLVHSGPGPLPTLQLIHVRFDAEFTQRNLARQMPQDAQLGTPQPPAIWVHAGHLAVEPAIALALRCVVC